jgi:hypothetical protein
VIEPCRATQRFSICFVPILAITVAGCAGSLIGPQAQKGPDPNLYPSNYRTDVPIYIRGSPIDFLKTREAYISAPALQEFGLETRYCVCLRTVTQDARKDTLVVFYGGRINQFVDAPSGQCAAAAYQPFPELMQVLSQFPGNK